MSNRKIVTRADASYARCMPEPYQGGKRVPQHLTYSNARCRPATQISIFYPMRACPGLVEGQWDALPTYAVTVENVPQIRSNNMDLREGLYYRETDDGVHQKGKAGEKLVSHFKVRIAQRRRRYYRDGSTDDFYICQLYDDAGSKKELSVKISEYKRLCDIVRKKFPDMMILPNAADAMEEYLTAVAKEFESKNNPVGIEVEARGWMEFEDGTVRYELGIDSYYKHAPIPNVSSMTHEQRRRIFQDGCSFLQIGDFKSQIVSIFLFAHLGFSLYWLKKAKIPVHSVLFVLGPTGSLKTSTTEAATNVFETDDGKKVLRLTSTVAATQEFFDLHRDNTVVVDDYSNSARSSNKGSKDLIEFITRACGDQTMPAKMGDRKIQQRDVRCAVIMTGEADNGPSESSGLRRLVVKVDHDTFKPKLLSRFQESQIMQYYFALYIDFLETNGNALSQSSAQWLSTGRETFKDLEKRLCDIAISLQIQSAWICLFGLALGIDGEDLKRLGECFKQGIADIMSSNAKEVQTLSPCAMFLYGLHRTMNETTGAIVADSEEQYIGNEMGYIGFWDDIELWIKFDKVYSQVKTFWKSQGQEFLQTPLQIKESLCEKGFIRTTQSKRGTKEYLLKSKKGSRKRMLVINREKFDEFVENYEL